MRSLGLHHHSSLRRLPGWLLPAIIGMPGFATAFQTSPGTAAVPFRLAHGFAVIVPVTIDGRGPYSFLLDTGSSNTSIDPALAADLQLHPENAGSVLTVVGRQPALVARAQSVSLGTVALTAVELLVRDLPGLRGIDRSLRGVLGQDALRRTDYLLDYRHRVLLFDGDGELLRSLEGERTPLMQLGGPEGAQFGSALVHTVVGERSAGMNLVLDSGSASLVLFAQPSLQGSASIPGSVRDDYGQRGDARVLKVRLCIGRNCTEAAAWSVPRGVVPGLDGLLPTWLFPSLYVSNSGGFTVLSPRPKRRPVIEENLATLKNGAAPVNGGR